jgi:hypothetical protein
MALFVLLLLLLLLLLWWAAGGVLALHLIAQCRSPCRAGHLRKHCAQRCPCIGLLLLLCCRCCCRLCRHLLHGRQQLLPHP